MGKDGTCWAWMELGLKCRAPGTVQGEAGFSPSGRDHSSQHSWGFTAMPDKSWQRSTT